MVKNFNVAFSHARGTFVAMITDDDPPYPEMLATLRDLSEKLPHYGAYYGAAEVLNENDELARMYDTHVGKLSCLADAPRGAIRTFSAGEFPSSFFSYRIFPYVLWSTGVVRHEIALSIGGMADYGSPYLTDFAYIALAGSQAGCATINLPLGYQTVHEGNFGRAECAEMKPALEGCYSYLASKLSNRSDWELLRPQLERYLGMWMVDHSIFLRRYFKRPGQDPTLAQECSRTVASIFELRFMRRMRFIYWLRVYLPYNWLPAGVRRRLRYLVVRLLSIREQVPKP
jgi:hypothetical protein